MTAETFRINFQTGSQGEEGDPTDVTIYLADEPITGKRGVQLENAYNMARTLEKSGWLVIENHDAMEVRLTDAGVRKVG